MTFLVILPIGIALWYALVRAGTVAQHFRFPLALAYWLCLLVPRWLLQDFATRLLHRAFARLRPPRLALLVAGGVLGIALFQPYALWAIAWFQDAFAAYIPSDARFALAPRGDYWLQGFVGTVPQHLVAIALWVVANLVYDRASGSARFAYAQVPPPRPPDGIVHAAAVATEPPSVPAPQRQLPVPSFAMRLQRLRPEEIIAIEAEDHYVRVHGTARSELIHYRFTDAVAELGAVPGMRVHRSYWVARDAIRAARRTGASQVLVLVNGAQIPIGRSYSEAVRQLGLVSRG